MKLSNGIPTYDEVMLPLLKIVAKGPLTRAEATEHVSEAMQLTPEQRGKLMPRGHSIIRDRVGWARTYLLQAGLVKSAKRGVFEITARGHDLLSQNPTAISIDTLMQFPEFKAFRERSQGTKETGVAIAPSTSPEPKAAISTPEDRIDAALQEIDTALREVLLDRIRLSTPEFFEQLVIELLVKMGYGGSRAEAAKHLGGPGDGGVDGVIQLDPLGIDLVYIQAKRYAAENGIGRPSVQSFSGALDTHGATRGVFMTTSYFSSDAVACAKAIHSKQIVLIDGDKLADLLIAYDVGVREDRKVSVKRLDEDFFE